MPVAIEQPQSPNRQGSDSLMSDQMMDHYRVPALSVAAVHDFRIEAPKAWAWPAW